MKLLSLTVAGPIVFWFEFIFLALPQSQALYCELRAKCGLGLNSLENKGNCAVLFEMCRVQYIGRPKYRPFSLDESYFRA